MKLQRVSIKNYRSIKELAFTFPKSGILVLVGANNAGKSNIIRAIDAICGEQWFGRDKIEDHDHYLRDKDNAIEIKLSFDDASYAKFRSDGDRKYPTFYVDDRPDWRVQPKQVFPCIYLGADRTFDKHMSFYDWTLIGKIRRAFHQRAQPVQDELNEKFEEVVKVFDLVDGFSEFKEDFSAFFAEMQADTSATLGIDFKPYTPSNYFKTMQVVAQDPTISDERLDLVELGEGSRNMVLLALLRSYAKNFREATEEHGGLIALEEPELYMHPQARRHLAKVLREIAGSGMQVIISTHSASFLDTEFFDSVGRVIKVEDDEEPDRQCTEIRVVSRKKLVDHCVETGVPAAKTTETNIGEFYKTTSNPMLNEAFFAKFVILVEGDTEELALPIYLEKEGFDCDLLGISIISVRGKSQIPKYWRLFSAFEIPLLVMADNDDDKGRKNESNKQLATCFGLDVDELLDVPVSKKLQSKAKPPTPIIMLEGDFETATRKDFEAWTHGNATVLEEWEEEARAQIRPHRGQNKGQVARFIARRMCKHRPDIVLAFIDDIVDVLKENGFRATLAKRGEPGAPKNVDAGVEDEDDLDF